MSVREKSRRREMSESSDESKSEKVTKHKYHSSDAHRMDEKYKKSKKSSKYRSESSSDSDGGYDSRKENKRSRRHKKKSSKRRNEKLADGSEDGSFLDESQEQRKYEKKDKRYKNDVPSEKHSYSSKSSRKKSKSQEKQRYGKWTENSDRNKVSQSYDEQTSYRTREMDYNESSSEDYTKRSTRDPTLEKYKNSKHNRYSKQFDESRTKRDEIMDYDSSRNKEMDDNERSSKDYTKRSTRDHTPEKYETSRHRRYPKQLDESGTKNDETMDCDSSRNNLKRRKETDAETIDDGSLRTEVETEVSKTDDVELEPLSKRSKIENINMRTGGAYIPPARLRMMQDKIKDKSSEQYQRIAWEALKKSIVGMTNKVNGSNITEIVRELFKENIIRGRGVLARAIMQAQAASPTFTKVYASLVSVINSKFPEVGELVLKRLIIQYRRGFRRNDKIICMTAARFLAHLLNQEVVHEILILEMITHLLEKPTEDSVEIAIAALKECGKKVTQLTPKGMRAITQRVRDVLHAGNMDVRTQYMIEVFFAVQKDNFKEFETISKELDLVEEEDKYTHLINLNDPIDNQEMLNVFKFDPEYLDIEEKYKAVVKEILGDSDDEDGESGAESDSEGEDENDEETKDADSQKIIDMTETNIVCLRRKIYLTIQSSLDFEECAHKLLKLELKPGQILEMCYMILDCCAQQRTYEKFYGLLAQRFCQMNKVYVEPFTQIFENSYKTIHRLETNKLRNVAKFFAHLLYTDAISWMVLAIIKLNEEDTTSSSRIFIKILFQELCEYMGLPKLNERVKDVTLQEAFDGLFPRDHPHNTRFAVNFFTSIGLGGLTDELREHLKNLPKTTQNTQQQKPLSSSSASSSASSSSSSSSSSSEE